jgi:hypothetical protein
MARLGELQEISAYRCRPSASRAMLYPGFLKTGGPIFNCPCVQMGLVRETPRRNYSEATRSSPRQDFDAVIAAQRPPQAVGTPRAFSAPPPST